MIVFLGWGSLIWDPDTLPIQGDWQNDGPLLRVDYLRQSRNGRLTLVLASSAALVPSLWVPFDGNDLSVAREALRIREGIPRRNSLRHIGAWTVGEPVPPLFEGLAAWAARVLATSVLWTALPPKFNNQDCLEPTIEQALAYLRALPPGSRALAEEYVRRTPSQVNTAFRQRFVAELNWGPSQDELADQFSRPRAQWPGSVG